MPNNSLQKKLRDYSLVATAILLGQSEADAQIVYHNYVPDLNPDYIDLNNDGVFDLKFTTWYTTDGVTSTSYGGGGTTTYIASGATVRATNDGAIAVTSPSGNNLQKLVPGQLINSSLAWCNCNVPLASYVWSDDSSFSVGYWNHVSGFFGIRFKVGNDKFYGWMRMSVDGGSVSVKDYAYNSIPNQPIYAGEDGCDWFNVSLQTVPHDTVCIGESIQLKAQPLSGINFEWYYDGVKSTSWDDAIETTSSGNHYISVIVTESGGCPDTSETHYTAHVNLFAPYIYLQDDTLFSSQTNVYQWYLNGDAIPGATDYFYVPATSGTYTLEIYTGNCYKSSPGFNYYATDAIQTSQEAYPKIIRQNSSLFIQLSPGENITTQYTVIDMLGRTRFDATSNEITNTISISDLEAGAYILVVKNNLKQTIFRFTKN